jgi:tight adherence protein B
MTTEMTAALAIFVAAAVLVWPTRGSTARALAGPVTAGTLDAGSFDRTRAGTEDSLVSSGGGGAGRRFRDRLLRRRGTVTPHDVLALLEGLAPALGAGLAPGDALALLVRVNLADPEPGRALRRGPASWREQLVDLGDRARDGEPLAALWRQLAREQRSAELLLLAQAWALSEKLGSPLSEAVTASTELVRERLRAERRVQAASAGARATMNLLTVLPVGGAAVAALLGISPVALYTRSPLAAGCLVLGLVLLLLGRLMVRRMVRRSLRPGAAA